MIPFIPFDEGEARLDWLALTDALEAGHDLQRAEIADTFLYSGKNTLLNRSAWIKGLGIAVKAATVFPQNPAAGHSMIHGAVNLFSDTTGALDAFVDFHLVTKWKTAADSLLAARKLARADASSILLVGTGTVGASLRAAYQAAFPTAKFTVWNRSRASAEAFAAKHDCTLAKDLRDAVGQADIIGCATMSTEPVLKGDWLRPGTHIDLIGAYRPDMREADDDVLRRATLFVDSRETTLGHIGEMKIPLEAGTIGPDDIRADFYELDKFTRQNDEEITLCKNGGGAHLDLMTARYILSRWQGG